MRHKPFIFLFFILLGLLLISLSDLQPPTDPSAWQPPEIPTADPTVTTTPGWWAGGAP